MEFVDNITYTADEVNKDFVSHIAPVSAVIALFAVAGIFGNLFVLYVHIFRYQSCNFRYFVLGLCAVDLTASLTILPMEVYTQLHWYIFPDSIFCKLKAFLHVFLSLSTVYVLLLIAIDRHRKVCYPYSWQVTSRSVLTGYGICFIVVCIQSWTVLLVYRKVEWQKDYKNSSVLVSTCTYYPIEQLWRKIYIAAMVPHFLAMAIMFILYSLVGYQVFRYVVKMRQKSHVRKRRSRGSMDERKINGVLKSKKKKPASSEEDEDIKSKSSSIIDNNLCQEVKATTQTDRELELVAYKVQENGIMFEKGSSVKRRGSDPRKLRMTFEEKKKMEERSTNHRVSRLPPDADDTLNATTSASNRESSKVCSTSESETDRIKEESTSKSSIQPHRDDSEHLDVPEKERVTKRVSLAERLTNRVKDLGHMTVYRTRKKVRFSGKARDKLRRRTLITFVFTTIFIVTTIIYLVFSGKVIREDKMSNSELSLFIFFYRLYFINSVIHPIIYGLLDPKFRKTLKQTTKNVIESVRSRHDLDNKDNPN